MCAQVKGGLSAQELMSLLDAGWHDYAVMLYRTFIDDSSDERREIVMVAGAAIGTHKQWSTLRRQWKARLTRDGLDYFRSTEYYSLRKQFERFRDPVKYPKPKGSEAATLLRNDLEAIVKKVGVIGFAEIIPMAMFKEITARPEIKCRFNPDPFSAAMQGVMRNVTMFVREYIGTNNRVAFVGDDGPNSAYLAAAYADFKRKNDWLSESMGGLAHLDDKKTPQLQVADMIASFAKELATEYIRTKQRVTPKRLEGSFYKLSLWKPETVLQVAGWQ